MMTLLQALKPFKGIKYSKRTMGELDDMLLDLLKTDGQLSLWSEYECEMVQVKDPSGKVILHIWKNWYPLWRIHQWEDCIVGLHWVTQKLKPVTIQCVVDNRPPWSAVKCPCNGGSADFVEQVRTVLIKAGFEVNSDVVNFEGA